ncbi:MAG: recombination protein RecR [Candidatus Levybacteria bacterium RIFCSPLOWO2_01_FULL_38_13]|nr:MAG: recombination protein RecR [Candidatus Levybacteria bacterium RIFCSPHIGHO2_01_FULL_41_15]OGH35089.1 MAG: recombination protein RecR [Candidatus Levybacteria bacterium RIFCSPLOWO2_01_FULL_38_13]
MRIPKAILNLIESFEKLPGIGPKTAQRLTFYLLHVPQGELDKFSESIQNLKKGTVLCSVCFAVGEKDPCHICADEKRDKSIICVVEEALDVFSIERSGKFGGVYHVLHGRIDPLNSIGPDEIYISQLLQRVKETSNGVKRVKEIILATNPTMEGEATAMYIAKKLREQSTINRQSPQMRDPAAAGQSTITRIGRGLPMGADIEYADEITLQRALEGRQVYE